MQVVVLGATGALGSQVAHAAVAAGHEVRVLARTPEQLVHPDRDALEVMQGDAASARDLARAVKGAEVLFHCVNTQLGRWKQWQGLHQEYLATVLKACNRSDTKVVLPGTVSVYGRGSGRGPIGEMHTPEPTSATGHVRLALESMLVKAPVRHNIVRVPDLYGPRATHPLLARPFRDAARGRRLTWLGPSLDTPCQVLLVSDAGRAMVTVGTAERTDDETFHVGGTDTTPGELLGLIAELAGCRARGFAVPKKMLRAARLLRREARLLRDVLQMWDDPVFLDGAKFHGRFGALQPASVAEGVKLTLGWYRIPEESAASVTSGARTAG